MSTAVTDTQSRRTIIPLVDARASLLVPPAEMPAVGEGPLLDQWARPLTDLRISVTDRCNFRCVYCMPKAVFDKAYRFLPQTSLLSFEEIERLAGIFVRQGVDKLRLTGGEPLLRKHLDRLIAKLAPLRTRGGLPVDLTLTTNASLLARQAERLRDAGLNRVTVSLDALDEALFARMNDVDFPVAEVLNGIEAAQRVGLPIKVNMVVKRGVNEHQIVPMARHFHGSGVTLRFIEYMDVGASNGWKLDEVMSAEDIVQRVHAALPLVEMPRQRENDTALRWRYADGGGEIGVVASVTRAFCGACSRARLSTEGRLFLCLFAARGYDLRSLLRDPDGVSDARLEATIRDIWHQRTDRYSQQRSEIAAREQAGRDDLRRERVEMSYIGG